MAKRANKVCPFCRVVCNRCVEGAVPYNQSNKITDKNPWIFVGEEQVSRKSADFPNRKIRAQRETCDDVGCGTLDAPRTGEQGSPLQNK